jgi:hypothetical protein
MSRLLAGLRPSLTVSGRVFTDLKNLLTLVARFGQASRYKSFCHPSSATGYAVTTGKNLVVEAGEVQFSALTGVQISLLYGDSSVTDTIAAPTNPVYLTGSTDMAYIVGVNAATYFETRSMNCKFTVPSTKVPAGFPNTGSLSGAIYGYEVD